MANPYFRFKQFTVYHQHCAMKVTTDACLFGAWCAHTLQKEFKKFLTVLDVGTGTGLLSLMVAQQNTVAIEAVEIDEKAAQQAADNVAASPWKDNIKVIAGNVFKTLLQPTYDVIISNPPFYENELRSVHAARNVAHHSQEFKLDDLFSLISQKLDSEGTFFLLLPYKRYAATEAFLKVYGLHLHQQIVVHTSRQHPPFRVLIKGGKTNQETESGTLYINESPNQYTPEFIHLLQDYYLYL
jgi:tRNA1Val (adenine37-N6)-methyltransferase